MKTKSIFIPLLTYLTIFSFFIAPVLAQEKKQERKRIAVLDFSANNVPPAYAGIVRNSVEFSLYKLNVFNMLEREHIKNVFKEQNIKKGSCKDTSCAVLIGKILSADYVIVGSIDKLNQYKITMRVVYVNEGRILFAYSEKFNSEKDIESIINKMSKVLSDYLKKSIKLNNIYIPVDIPYEGFFSTSFNYIYPVGKFGDLVNPGYGITLSGGISDLFIDKFILGIEIGYFTFSGKANSSDQVTFMPILLNAGYRIELLKDYYLYPSISTGFNYITLKHGSGEGLEIKENSKQSGFEYLSKAGLFLGFSPLEQFRIQIGSEFASVKEDEGYMNFLVYSVGLVMVF